jgi:hypothetical protein
MFNSLRRWVVAGVAAMLVAGIWANASQAAPPTRVIVRPGVTVPISTSRFTPTFVVSPFPSPPPLITYRPGLGQGYSNVLANNANVANTLTYNAYLSSLYSMPYVNPYAYSAYTPFLYNPYYYNPYGPASLGLYP